MTNIEIERAERIVTYTQQNLFLTGRAGTGKTTFLKRLRQTIAKRMVVLAPTGIAAINAGGQTIHSFFQFPFTPYVPGAPQTEGRFKVRREKIRLIRQLDLIVIDEISMVRADLLDRMDDFLKRYRRNSKPFGGVQLLLIGDLCQLTPVVKDDEWQMLRPYYASPYFFASHALAAVPYSTISLTHIYRQTDADFINLLNAVREGRTDAAVLAALNARYLPREIEQLTGGYVHLVTHNHQAQSLNQAQLDGLKTAAQTYEATIKGDFPDTSQPAEQSLTLKVGAQVMFLRNKHDEQIYNGMIGTVEELLSGSVVVRTDEPEPRKVEVGPEVWENMRYQLDKETGEIKEEVAGIFSQIPLRLAWAITIHKSQGLTFDRVVIDARAAFAHGQTYVALSRCRTLGGIYLSSPVSPAAIITDRTVDDYQTAIDGHQPDDVMIAQMERDFFCHTACSLFDFSAILNPLSALVRLGESHLAKLYPDTCRQLTAWEGRLRSDVVQVAEKFYAQINRLVSVSTELKADATLQDRIRAGSIYFAKQLRPLRLFVAGLNLTVDNKEVAAQADRHSTELSEQLDVAMKQLDHVAETGFELKDYLRFRAKAAMQLSDDDSSQPQKTEKNKKAKPTAIPEDVKNVALFERLTEWRRRKMAELERPAFTILSTKALIGIANQQPTNSHALLAIDGIGPTKVRQFGDEIIEMVCDFMAQQA